MDDIQHGSLSGTVSVLKIGGSIDDVKNPRELRFKQYDKFPSIGETGVLYIDTYLNDIYFWDGVQYQKCTQAGGESIIDDERTAENKTWSSQKISGELSEDQQQIDSLSYEVITNLEIDALLNM